MRNRNQIAVLLFGGFHKLPAFIEQSNLLRYVLIQHILLLQWRF